MRQINNYRFLQCTNFVKYCIFVYELVFVLGVIMDRWHHSRSVAVRKIYVCALVTAFERFCREEVSSLIGFVWAKYFCEYLGKRQPDLYRYGKMKLVQIGVNGGVCAVQ